MPNVLLQYREHKFYVDEYSVRKLFEFTDHTGREIEYSVLGLFDPRLHKKCGFTTLNSVLKWFVSNRDKIFDNSTGYYDWTIRNATKYFEYFDSYDARSASYEYLKERLSGTLNSPSLILEEQGQQHPSQFLLATEDQPEPDDTIPLVLVEPIYFRKLNIILLTEQCSPVANVHSRWTEHWNHAKRMDESDFNWFRSVAKENTVFFGMELEISTKLTTLEIQHIVANVEPKQEPFFIFKQDSTITGKYDHMLELVTVPATPRYLRKNWKIFFSKLEKLCAAKGKSISDFVDTSETLGNGLHIHVSKDNFLGTTHMNKFMTAWHQWDRDATGIIGEVARRPSDYTTGRWCKVSNAYKGTQGKKTTATSLPKFERQRAQRSLAMRLKGLTDDDKYVTAHTRNAATVEVRVYQGIFDIKHIMQCISFTEAMFEYCQNIGYSGFDANFAPKFTQFVQSKRKFAALTFKYNQGEAA